MGAVLLGVLVVGTIVGVALHEVHLARARRRQRDADAGRAPRWVRDLPMIPPDAPTMRMPTCLHEPASERLERLRHERDGT